MPESSSSRIDLPIRSQSTADSASDGDAIFTPAGDTSVDHPIVTIRGWRVNSSPGAPHWERHRATIKRLYIDEGNLLKHVAEIMKRDYGFEATTKMYKARLSKWGYFKNNRKVINSSESRTKSQKRAVESTLKRLVQPAKPVVLRDPDLYWMPNCIFSCISTYMWGSYEGGRWTSNELACAAFYENAYCRPSAELINSIGSLTKLLQARKYRKAGPSMRQAAIQMENVLRYQPVDLLTCLLEIALRLHSTAPELAVSLMRHSANMTKIYFPSPKHPVRVFTHQLASLGSAEVGAAVEKAYTCQLETWQRIRYHSFPNSGNREAAAFVWITGLALAGDLEDLSPRLIPRLDDLAVKMAMAVKGSEWCEELLRNMSAAGRFQLYVGRSGGRLIEIAMQLPGTPTKVIGTQPTARYSLAHLNTRCRHFSVQDRSRHEAMEVQWLLQTEMGSFFLRMAGAIEEWLYDIQEYDKAAAVARYRERFQAAGLVDVQCRQ